MKFHFRTSLDVQVTRREEGFHGVPFDSLKAVQGLLSLRFTFLKTDPTAHSVRVRTRPRRQRSYREKEEMKKKGGGREGECE